ncbi:DUF2794 domain-containing protein [Stappia sp.]|uniref:DUF2794 domain-containing protein n=1 Tax=Stappia sp. TaxID=1870903 RepID=UPI003A99A5EA
MSEVEDETARRGADGAPDRSGPAPLPITAFHRRELDLILRVYGQKVAAGEWRDYAIDHLKDRAVFSIFRRSSEMPLYRIEKVPRNARRQGAYAVVGVGGAILKRGGELAQVLRVFEKKRHLSLV